MEIEIRLSDGEPQTKSYEFNYQGSCLTIEIIADKRIGAVYRAERLLHPVFEKQPTRKDD